MLREVVSSSTLRSIGYDSRTRTLEVEFATGSVYRYLPVPGEVWTALRRAESKGRYFQRFVRDRFEAERVS
ncbi:MAG: KTSC domain-containing protein [Myxococcales bacterium]|nr:MAG: KTSC domain-containing protein [Myxococcales bacterium]